jgi:two-component system cell cycle sensor histidine kinase PleC
MRSTEVSGVDGDGLAAIRSPKATEPPLWRRAQTLPPMALAITLVALIGTTLCIAMDLGAAIADHREHQQVVSRLGLDQPAAAALVTTEADLGGVWQRGTATGLLAVLVIGLAWRRRRPEPVRQTVDARDLLSSIPFGVACWTREGELITCNEQYRARLDLPGSPLVAGAPYPTSIGQLSAGGYMHLLRENQDNRLIELHRADGSCLLIDERPLGPHAFITLISDVTETRRTDQLLATIREEQRLLARRYHEEKLKAEAANRAKSNFLAHLSHDIRTPLNHIIGFAELMRQQTYGALGDARYLNYVEAVKGSGERLLSYFASILELAEFDSGRRPQRLEPIDVDDLLLATTRRFSAGAMQAGLGLQLGERCGATLLGDRGALERMIGNLVENALRFTPRGGRIKLGGHAAMDGVVIEITDSGVGMSEQQIEQLSLPFSYSDAVLTRAQQGAGLGIAIARAIAEASGGRLAIDSRQGIGTTIAISLPLQPEAVMTLTTAAAA